MKTTILLLLLMLAPLAMQAEQQGRWVTHQQFLGTATTSVVDAGDKVYYLDSHIIYCFDKASRQTRMVTMNGALPTGLYFNSDRDLLVVTYDDSNIDIVAADGTVNNVPNIANAVITSSKEINDVTFAGNRIYVATNYGYCVISGDASGRFTFNRSFDLGKAVTSVAQVGSTLLVSTADNALYQGDAGSEHSSLASLKITGLTGGKIYPVTDSAFFLTRSAALVRVSVGSNGTLSESSIAAAAPENVQKTPTGYLANFMAKGYYYTFDNSGLSAKQENGGKAMFSSYAGGDGTLWSVNSNGLHSSTASATFYKPNAIDIASPLFWMVYNEHQKKMYLAHGSWQSKIIAYSTGIRFNTFDGETWANATPTGTLSQNMYEFAFDPNQPDNFFYVNGYPNGNRIYRVVGGKSELMATSTNSPMVNRRGCLDFDSKGNLWYAQTFRTTQPGMVLPKEKLYNATLSKSDWIVPNLPSLSSVGSWDYASFAIDKVHDVKVLTVGEYETPVVIWDDGGDITNVNPKSAAYTSFRDQNDNAFSWTYTFQAAADRKGKVLIGFTEGLISMDPTQAFDKGFRVHKTSELAGINCYTIAVDTLNRRWVGTGGSGLYLIDSDDETVLRHFTNTNSQLISNVVLRVCANTTDNSVMIITPVGVQQYFPEASSAAEDYSGAYAYPDPVTPTFTGLVTITGLMANSHVVVKDKDGNTVATLTGNEAGKATWDGCDASGERLPTGTYQVFAWQNGQMPAKPCTHIQIIK